MATGYVIRRSLSENDTRDKDINSLNNLTTDGIRGAANDIALFINNLRNESVIKSDEYDIDGNYVVLNKSTLIPFSNETIVEVDNVEYKVIDSNGIDRFRLQEIGDVESIFVPLDQDIKRNDGFNLDNIINISPERIPTVLEGDGEQELFSGNISFDDDDDDDDFYDRTTIQELINDIDGNIDLFNYKKSETIILDGEIFLEDDIDIHGSILVENLIGGELPQTQNSIENDDPGVFIASSSGVLKRAFSDSNNPWDDTVNAGYNTTQASKATVGNLIVTDPVFSDLAVNSNTSTEIPVQKYRLPVTIHGEEYNLILIQ